MATEASPAHWSSVQFKKRKTELAQYETVDCGKPIVEAEADLVSPCTLLLRLLYCPIS